jgi:hypothetical protein
MMPRLLWRLDGRPMSPVPFINGSFCFATCALSSRRFDFDPAGDHFDPAGDSHVCDKQRAGLPFFFMGAGGKGAVVRPLATAPHSSGAAF